MKNDNGTNEASVQELSMLRGRVKELESAAAASSEQGRFLEEAATYAKNIIDTVREPLIALDQDLRVVTASRSFYVVFKVTPEETVGQLIYDLGNKQWDIPRLRELLGTILPQKATFDNYEVEHDFATIGRRIMLLNARQIHRVLGKERIILLSIEDVTARRKLDETQSELAAIVESADDAIIGEDLDGNILSWNGGAENIYGYNSIESIGKSISSLIPAGRPDEYGYMLTKVAHGETIKHYETQRRRKDGQIIDVSLTISPVKDTSGKIVSASSISTDITERRAIEIGLEKARKELEKAKISDDKARHYAEDIIDTVREPLLVLDSSLKIISANRSFYNFFKVTSQETIGNLIYDLGNRQWDISELRVLLEDIIPKDATFDGYQIDHTFQSIGRKVMLLNARQIQMGEAYDNLLLLAIEDVTERTLLEIELKESEGRFRRLFETAKDGLLLLNKQTGIIVDANKSIADLLGYSSEELVGRNLQDTGLLVHIADFNETIKELIQTGMLSYEDVPSETRDGEILHTDIYLVDRAKYIQCNVRDITERIQAADKVNRDIEKLAALRVIDTAINGSLDLRIVLNVLLEQAILRLRVDSACVLLFDPYSQILEYASGLGFMTGRIAHARIPLGEGFAGRAAHERKTIAIPEIAAAHAGSTTWQLIEDEGFKAYVGIPLIAKGQVKGVLEIFSRSKFRPEDDFLEFAEALAGQAAIALDNAEMFENLERTNSELLTAYDTTIAGWSRALDYRDKETEGHSIRVTEMAVRVCKAIGMGDEELVHVRRGALLHDIGKLGVPDSILLKPGKLTVEEFDVIKKHPDIAFRLLSPIEFLRKAIDIPYCHHEKWDGSGYPRGLKGEEIPPAARIFSIVDVWDALCSDRPYRPAWSEEKAREYIRLKSGIEFDPKFVEVILSMAGFGTQL